jgi:GDPmannose 4,6-dehydratase
MQPQSPYGVSKLAAYHLTKVYRNAYGLFASNGILFNHESPRRGLNFVTRKITLSIADIIIGRKNKIVLGNLDAKRDWGFSKEYVEAIWLILQQDKPDDFVIATEETHTIREFVEEAFSIMGLNWKDFVEISDKFKRPADVPALLGDPTKCKNVIKWQPKTKFKDLVKMMLASDLKAKLEEAGHVSMGDGTKDDDFYIEKAKELAKGLLKQNKDKKINNVLEALDDLKEDVPLDTLNSIRDVIKRTSNENQLERA